MTDGLNNLRQQMKDNQKRWKRINSIVDNLNNISKDEVHRRSELNTELLMLIVDQLRPAADYKTFDKDLNKFQKDVGTLIDSIMKVPGRK